MGIRVVGRLMGGVSALVLTTGCGTSTTVPTYAEISPYAMQALTSGRLAVHDDCLILIDSTGASGIAWPEGVVWNELARTIELEGSQASVGDEVVLAGGEAQWPAETDAAAWVVPPTAGCLTTDRYWKVSDLVEVSTSQDDGAS